MNQTRLDEFNRLVHSTSDLKTFYEGFLTAVARISDAKIGVAWNCTDEPYHPICQVISKSSEPARLAISEKKHLELIGRAVENTKAFMIKPQGNGAVSDQPTLMFGPVKRDNQIELVEFILPRNERSEEDNKAVLRELDHYCALAGQFSAENLTYDSQLESDADDVPEVRGFRPMTRESIDQYAHAVHSSLDYKETARTVVNEARRVLDCDRVSIALKKGSRFKLIAISGQPSVNRRSNTVQMLSRLTQKALATEQAFWYPDESDLPPQLSKPLNDYLGFSSTRSMAIIPIFDKPVRENLDPNAAPQKAKVVAGLIVEQSKEQWSRQRVAPAIEIASRHGADALRNSLGHKSLFLYPLWRFLGQSTIVTSARNLPKTLAAIAGMAFLAAILTLMPASFTLHSDGVLLPQHRRKVFSEIDGQIEKINVSHAQAVAAGEQLLAMTNDELQFKVEQINGDIAGLKARLKANKTMRINNRASEDRELMQENTKALQSEIESLEKRKATLEMQAQKLSVVSPIAGEVMTWNVADQLRDRPVKLGDLLLEVADVDGEWELELNLPDRRIGHLLRELKKQEDSGNDSGIEVTYQLAADPSSRFKGRIKNVSRSTQLTADQKQGIRVLVEINSEDVEAIRQARSGVSAKIHCGEQPIGYVWFHDLFEFVQSRVLFRVW